MKAKKWTAIEDAALEGFYNRFNEDPKNKNKSTEEIDEMIATKFPGRTANGIRQRRSKLTLVSYTRTKKQQTNPNRGGRHKKPQTFGAPLQLELIGQVEQPYKIEKHPTTPPVKIDIKPEAYKEKFVITELDAPTGGVVTINIFGNVVHVNCSKFPRKNLKDLFSNILKKLAE